MPRQAHSRSAWRAARDSPPSSRRGPANTARQWGLFSHCPPLFHFGSSFRCLRRRRRTGPSPRRAAALRIVSCRMYLRFGICYIRRRGWKKVPVLSKIACRPFTKRANVVYFQKYFLFCVTQTAKKLSFPHDGRQQKGANLWTTMRSSTSTGSGTSTPSKPPPPNTKAIA